MVSNQTTYAERTEIERKIHELGEWFHNMNIGGVQTAPRHFLGDYPAVKWNRFAHAIPADLTGKSVLDIGCNAGFYAFEMKRRGADRVVAIDDEERYLAQARFAAETNALEIEFHRLSVYDLAQLNEKFDLVLFLGVFYHLRHPLLALDLIRTHATKDLFVFQSMQRGTPKILKAEPDYDFWETSTAMQAIQPTGGYRILRACRRYCEAQDLRSFPILRKKFLSVDALPDRPFSLGRN
jgi:tRNA (mo5U34)-methyltransferase